MDMTILCSKLVEDTLDQAIYALGCGAELPIKRAALVEWRDVLRPGFLEVICSQVDPIDPIHPTDPGEPRWNKYKTRVLDLCVGVGRLATTRAIFAGKTTIGRPELRDAYLIVRVQPQPGRFCPDWPT